MRLYNSLIISIITYSSASWTNTKAQKKRLDAFNTKTLRRIVGVRHDYVTNRTPALLSAQDNHIIFFITTTISKLRLGKGGRCVAYVACVAGHVASRTSDLQNGLSWVAVTTPFRDIYEACTLVSPVEWLGPLGRRHGEGGVEA